jgi:release factor glutamine methyltransferase
LCFSAGLSEERFFSNPEEKLTRKQERLFKRLLTKRLSGIPLAYLTGKKEFWSIPFKVFPGVLIPRPETELIVEKVLELSSGEEEKIIDIGTGCGNIAVSLARELHRARIYAVDISGRAVRAARLNASLQGISSLKVMKGDLFSPLRAPHFFEQCSFIVSNPPYVSDLEWRTLQAEIREHEPKKALVPGKSGLEMIKKLIEGSDKFLKPEGYLIFEIGAGQESDVLRFFDGRWKKVCCFNDLSGIPRVVAAQKAS